MRNQSQETERVGLVDVVKATNYKAFIPLIGGIEFDRAADDIEWKLAPGNERMANGDLRRVRTGKKVGLESHAINIAYQALTMGASIYKLSVYFTELTSK